ncbi:MAG: hypothetical protein LIO76_10620 [Clostridiales bacterium]|nr:hypothetical protein [Clostridiales bacterium]
MKRKFLPVLTGLAAALMLTACGNNNSTDTETEAPAAAEAESETETEEGLEAITPSDYLVENAADYITLGDLEGLEVIQYTNEITDETVQEEIDYELEMYSEETDVDRAAESGDVIYLTLVSTIEGSDESYSEDTYFYLGDAEYGEEFDEALIGASAADELSFSITFSEDAADELLIDETWAGQTVNFEATIDSVCELSVPEYNDEFVAEYTDYSTTEEYEEALKAQLEEEYEEYSYADVLESLITAALDECEISEIPEDLYNSCYEETIESYSLFVDADDEEELLEELDMTQEDLDTEVEDLAARRLLISCICEDNDIEVTEDDYVSYVEENAEYYGYDSAADFEADMIRSYLVWSLYESRATEILYNTASITTESYDEIILTDEEAEYLDEDQEEDQE